MHIEDTDLDTEFQRYQWNRELQLHEDNSIAIGTVMLGIGVLFLAGIYLKGHAQPQIQPQPQPQPKQPPPPAVVSPTPTPTKTQSTDIFGTVTKIIDGDTLEVTTKEGKRITIRPPILNTPNAGEKGRNEATAFTKNLCLGKPVRVDVDDGIPGGPKIVDGSGTGRTIGQIYCDGQLLDKLLVDKGHAKLTFTRYCAGSEFGNLKWLCPSGRSNVAVALDGWDFRLSNVY